MILTILVYFLFFVIRMMVFYVRMHDDEMKMEIYKILLYQQGTNSANMEISRCQTIIYTMYKGMCH